MKDLTRGNIYKTFILFAIPLVLSGVLSQCYNLIDTVIAGKFLGDNGLAAIGCTAAFISFSSSIFWGYAAGASIHIAALFGARKYRDIKAAVYHNLGTLTAASVAFGLLVVLCDDWILRFLYRCQIISGHLYYRFFPAAFKQQLCTYHECFRTKFLPILYVTGLCRIKYYRKHSFRDCF